MGKFIDSDEPSPDGKPPKLEWEGFLKDEFIHFSMGYAHIVVFGLVLFICMVIILIPFLRILKPSLINEVLQNKRLKVDADFKTQLETKSKEQHDLIEARIREQDALIKEYLHFCKHFSRPFCKNAF